MNTHSDTHSDVERLRAAAKRVTGYQRERQRRLYRLARELGFSAVEATYLSGRSETLIRQLAAERETTEQ